MPDLPLLPDLDAIERPRAAASPRIDTTRVHPARRYDAWLGGKDNFAVDRESARRMAEAFPSIQVAVRENRRFLVEAVKHVAQQGVRQFFDIGTGIPTSPNTHEVAQSITPDARILYVDNDPLVLVHARALLTSGPHGETHYLEADLRDPDSIVRDPDLKTTLNLSEPVALMLVAVLHFLPDSDDPQRIVGRLLAALPPGSYLIISHATGDHMSAEERERVDAVNRAAGIPFQLRGQPEVAAFFDGLELLAPGVVSIAHWPPGNSDEPRPSDVEVACYGGVARISSPVRS